MRYQTGNIGNKQISINMAANIVAYASNLLISFILTPFLINTIGKETYSFYPIANTIVSYMSVLTNSMNTVASRFVTVSLVQGKEKEANKYYSSVVAADFVMGIVLLVPMLFLVLFLEKFMEVPINSIAAIKGLFSLVFASTLVNIFGSVFGIATFAKNRIDLRSLREIVTAILRLILYVILYNVFPPSIIYVGIVTFLVAIVNVLFQYIYTRYLLPEIVINRKNMSFRHIKEVLFSSVWNVINSLGNTLLTGMTLILSNLLYGAVAAGTYSIVQIVPGFINGVITMLVGVFYPIITYKYALNDKKDLVDELLRSEKMIGFVTCATIVVFTALSEEFFTLWTPNENAQFLSILSAVTIIPHICISCVWSLTNLNVVMNKIKIPAVFTLLIGIANIIISVVVYKIWNPGLISLAIISTILQLLWIVIFIPQYACKSLSLKWTTFYLPILHALLCAVPVFIGVYILKQFVSIDNWIKFIGFGGIMGIVALVVFAFGMLGTDTIKECMQSIIKYIKD